MAMESELAGAAVRKPVTLKYPFERRDVPPRFRGRLAWDAEKCVGCGMCVQVCPAFALEMVGKGPMAELRYYLNRCVFCSQCVESCPRDALSMTEEYELADYKHKVYEFKRG
ncbi:MAG: ferredoxin [Candidatus Hecatellales archaeon]|nr:MAG: ferredoxin [Candidatus Hecatellales archaeon]